MISVVMPAHNEEGYLEPAVKAVVGGLRERARRFEVIVAENGSTDGTRRELEFLTSTYPEVTALHLAAPDYGRALRAGFLAAQGEIVVNFDVDFVDLDFLDGALDHLDGDPTVDLVLGSKRAPGSSDNRSVVRRTITAGFSILLKAGFGLRVTDTHGVKAMRRAALEPLVNACRLGQDVYDTELVLRAERVGRKVIEIPVTVEERRPARTSIARRIPRSLLRIGELWILLWQERRRHQ